MPYLRLKATTVIFSVRALVDCRHLVFVKAQRTAQALALRPCSRQTGPGPAGNSLALKLRGERAHLISITTTCLAWERLARSLLSCVSSIHRSNSAGPNRSRGSISLTTR